MQQSQQTQPVLLFTIRFHNNRPQLAPAHPLAHTANTHSITAIQQPAHCLTFPPVLNTTSPSFALSHSHSQEALTLPETLAKVASEPARECHFLLGEQ